MNKEKLIKLMAVLVFFIFILNILGMKFYLYFSLWYFDVIMHFLGGFWLGLAFIWLFFYYNFSVKLILKIFFGVLIIGILWEIFEFIVDKNIARHGFDLFDTLSDLCFDLAGGLSAVVYFYGNITLNNKNKL